MFDSHDANQASSLDVKDLVSRAANPDSTKSSRLATSPRELPNEENRPFVIIRETLSEAWGPGEKEVHDRFQVAFRSGR